MPTLPPKTRAIRELLAMLRVRHLTKVKGHPLYYCDRNGNIYNRWGYMMSPLCNGPYKMVSISEGDGKFQQKSIHRMIAETFIPNPDGKPQVNHKDGNKFNNSVDNLEWVSRSENQKHRFTVLGHNHFGEKNPGCKLTEKKVVEILTSYKTGRTSYSKLARLYNISVSTVHDIVTGVSWNHITGLPPTRKCNQSRLAILR